MIVDTSAIIAILKSEPGRETCLQAPDGAGILRMSAATYVEASMVVEGLRNPIATRRFDELLEAYAIGIEALTESQARIARAAFRQFGKGMDHPARLSFGDCFSYALARERGEPLLFTGDDFAQTDIRPAVAG